MDRSLTALPIPLCETDRQGRLTGANEAFRLLALGGAPITLGVAPWSHAAPHVRSNLESQWNTCQASNTSFVAHFALTRLDGTEVVVALSAHPRNDTTGQVSGYMMTAQDITPLVTHDRLNSRLLGALDAASDALVVYDAQSRLVFANQGAAVLLGISDSSDATHETAHTFLDAVKNQVPREVLGTAARSTTPAGGTTPTKSTWSGEIGHRSPDGIMRTLAITLHVMRTDTGTVEHFSIIARDVTDHKHVQAELQRQATHDELTGLPNRTLFLRRVAEALDRSRTLQRGLAVLFIDFDGLKHINDTAGHRFGDQLIISVGKRLVNATRPSDVVARLSGDEFAVLAEGVTDESLALEIAERLRASITGQHIIHGVEVTSGASVGVAIAAAGAMSDQSPTDAALNLLVNADTAMYRAKQRGKGRSEVYSEAMRTQARDRLALAAQLERALANDELFIAYQPIVSIHTGRIVAVEALLRWRHPERGVLTPPAFLEVADETGAIGPIGDWVLATAARTMRTLIDEGTLERSVALHINASARQLSDAGFVERTTATIAAAGLDARQLVIEFTEATALGSNSSVTRSLNALARLDVRLAIDDFGTGFSSLAHLRDFAASMLKLDGTFIRNVGRDGADDPIVRSMVQLAHSLDMAVVAEWVQSTDQLQRLRLLGCDYAQGNHVCEPTDETGIRDLAQRYSGVSGAGPLPE